MSSPDVDTGIGSRVRQRKDQERERERRNQEREAMKEKVETMKQKMKDSERWDSTMKTVR